MSDSMKDAWIYILLGLVVVAFEWAFLIFFAKFFNGFTPTEALIVATALFLAFEMIICTGAIISKFDSPEDE